MVDNLSMIERTTKANESMIRVGSKNYLDLFRDELHRFEQKYTELHKPYDRACARIDFEDRYNEVLREIERIEGFIDFNDKRLKIDFGDLEKYGDIKRFALITKNEDRVNRIIDGTHIPVLIGHTENYLCNARNHRIAVFIPSEMEKTIKT